MGQPLGSPLASPFPTSYSAVVIPPQLGPYPIEREIGRGGMGVVYLGRDRKLDRPVAIKVLPDVFARDPERLARFEREARLLASLTHPNIAGIHGIEEADGRRFLVLEYVEGDTLAQRLHRGALPLEETLDVCRQVATALEAAHEAGIVHRDLKPGNVKLTPAGDVKVLDFGLAKGGAASADSTPDMSQSPTMAMAATGAGVILGTAAYMSPEQARGKPVDRRTDIWSFGCVLYECLTGAQAFTGETVSDLIAMILQGEPDASKLPANTPEKLRLLLARCLERDAKRRLRDIGDARIEIEELQGRHSSTSRLSGAIPGALVTPASRGGPRWKTFAGGAALLLAGAVAGVIGWRTVSPRPEAAPVRFTIHPPARLQLETDPNHQAISPDGKTLAFVAVDSTGQGTLWLRPIGSFEARELPGTKNASLPFWSPDGRQLGFFSDGKLKRTSVAGGPPQPICDAATGRGASWSTRNVIVFSGSPAGPLFQVPAGGGTPRAVTQVDSARGETGHRWPCFLPDGEHFTYAALPEKAGQFVSYVGSIGGKPRTELLSAEGAPVFAAPGHLIFRRNEALQAQRFDPSSRRLSGEPFSIGRPPAESDLSGSPGASVSTNGVLSWIGAGAPERRIVWIDRAGREVGAVDLPLDRWELMIPSRDGRRAVIVKEDASGGTDLWTVDLEREVANRLTDGTGTYTAGPFSPDGKRIAYGSTRLGPRDIYRRAADGSGVEEVVYQSRVPFKDVVDWSPDGRWLVIQEIGDDNGWNLLVLPAEGGTPRPYLVTSFDERLGMISPDGRWLLYMSDETGTPQSFVQTFPIPGRKQQVTKTGAYIGFWRGDGREIFITRPDLSVVAVPVTPGEHLTFGPARELYRLPHDTRSWTNAPDGQRFLVVVPAERSVTEISVAVNWRAGRER